MARYFTVDRQGLLQAGQEIVPDSNLNDTVCYAVKNHFTRNDLEGLAHSLFPEGLTPHGKRYLFSESLVIRTPEGPAQAVPHIPIIELVAELVRRLHFPHNPSRFQALFAWETLQEAEHFQQEQGGGWNHVRSRIRAKLQE